MRACKICHRLMSDERCPVCQQPTTAYWGGYLGVIDPDNSRIANLLNKKTRGQYAIKTR